MKREYLELEIDVLLLLQEDIITASDENDVVDDPYGPGNDWWKN